MVSSVAKYIRARWNDCAWADFSGDRAGDRPELTGGELCALILRRLSESPSHLDLLRIRGLTVLGTLRLNDLAMQAGNTLPALIFHDCRFELPDLSEYDDCPTSIDLGNGVLPELTLVSCAFVHLDAPNCVVT